MLRTRHFIFQLKPRKAADKDQVAKEMLKASYDKTANKITQIFSRERNQKKTQNKVNAWPEWLLRYYMSFNDRQSLL